MFRSDSDYGFNHVIILMRGKLCMAANALMANCQRHSWSYVNIYGYYLGYSLVAGGMHVMC